MLSRPALVVLAAAALAVSGCGGDGGGDGSGGGNSTAGAPPATTGPPTTTPAPEQADGERELRPSPQERSLRRDLERHLREDALTRSRGEWTFADVRDVEVRDRQVMVSTRLRGRRGREQASSLCLSTREFFLAGGRAQTPYDVVVTDGRAALAAC
jgi:hypothetical protein